MSEPKSTMYFSAAKRKSRRRTASRPISDTSSAHANRIAETPQQQIFDQPHVSEADIAARSTRSTASAVPESASPPRSINPRRDHAENDRMKDSDTRWLDALYREGFEVVFGSWMGRYSCPFLFGHNLADKYVSISDLCRHLDGCIVDSGNRQLGGRDGDAEISLQSTISAFAARWLPVTSEAETNENHRDLVQSLWRHARRDMLRVMNRPSYRSMLSLLLFALTPIPEGISEEEETYGMSGQACVHAALQQIQTLRARHRYLHFSGSKVSASLRSETIVTTPESIESSGFINAESTVYWAALTFDTSASLTLSCRPLLSSGLFGFESELPWRLVRTCAKMFDENARQWKQASSDMTDERANQIIAAGASWKLLGWKLTAIFKEALRDGHEEPEVRKSYFAVVDSIKQFGIIYRPLLDECYKRMPFLGQKTKLRWFSLMLHYHLSILMLVDIIEATDRQDLLPDIADISTDAENTVMNTLAFGLHNTFTLKRPCNDSGGKSVFTIPIVSIDPYPHHAVAGVQLLRKGIDRDFEAGKIMEETYQSLLSTLEQTLRHLPQSSKSVQAAIAKFSTTSEQTVHDRWSSTGNDVHLVDSQQAQLQASVEAIDEFRAYSTRANASWGKIITHSSDTLSEALQSAWLVVECVPERLELKQKVVTELDSLTPKETIIASNSSSYSCSEILEGLELKHESRFLSAHSYWPPEVPEIEIMGHENTDASHITLMMEKCKAHGFSPFHVKKPSMGYIYNRIWAAIKREALLTAAEGVATPEEIDGIFKGVLKTPKGPFEQMDLVGLDVVMDIEQHYADARGNIPSEPRQYLQKFLDEGNLGIKSGRGFYDYSRI
ncbi:3-hydroxybutyryl- dehydrogenase [Fusarium longipes]|uniref:3-hydroxybutyryl-dehydrogenase n=1 Tax=Fusarium longipes TaxID=694270 RepID=A0A395RJY4_9HYPO|nr:3-hydroxybutyryl- dehydrogenase [Fusarium longipes]